MKNCNLLYSPWRYKIAILYEIEGKRYYEDFSVITRKNYSDIKEQFTKFIMRDLKVFFHDYDIAFISADIAGLEALYW